LFLKGKKEPEGNDKMSINSVNLFSFSESKAGYNPFTLKNLNHVK
jgi:hypothetical protein